MGFKNRIRSVIPAARSCGSSPTRRFRNNVLGGVGCFMWMMTRHRDASTNAALHRLRRQRRPATNTGCKTRGDRATRGMRSHEGFLGRSRRCAVCWNHGSGTTRIGQWLTRPRSVDARCLRSTSLAMGILARTGFKPSDYGAQGEDHSIRYSNGCLRNHRVGFGDQVVHSVDHELQTTPGERRIRPRT